MAKTAEINASGLAPVQVKVPQFNPAEPAVFAKKRAAARKALVRLQPPSDKKYTNWLRREIAERFEDKAIGTVSVELDIKQEDYDTGLKTIAIPLAKAIKDWPGQVAGFLLEEALLPDAHYFSALSGALYAEGAAVVVPPNTTAEITIDYTVEADELSAARTVVIVSEGAKATIFERWSGGKGATVTHGAEVYAKENSQAAYHILQDLDDSAAHLAAYRSHQGKDSKLDWLAGTFGGNFSQIYVESGLAGAGAESHVHGTFYGSGEQHFEQQLVANHLVGDTTSDTYARGIVDDQSKAVYRGMIKIQKGAHGSSADQNGHAMLLSDDAHVDAIPGLEIDADDVTAGHGATVGQIDEEQLFYLMSRGLSRAASEKLILRGFFEDLFKRIKSETAHRAFWQAVEARLA